MRTPSHVAQAELQKVLPEIKKHIGTLDFVALHARVEDDWIEYCKSDWFKVSNAPVIRLKFNNI